MDSQAALVKSLETIRAQSALMRKSLDADGRLLVATKYASTMLGELRTAQFSPKQYYELYIACFDALSQLASFLREDHENHHLADIYEMVQYTGNIVPRLYLMITVGSAYMSIPNAPIRDILKDMLEMCRGVQHPLRGLFLRYYLGQRTREYLPWGENSQDATGCLNDSIRFTLTNFIEMNKLWVRYQHQGHSREWAKRLLERKELQIIVGSNLVRLAQLEGVTAKIYAERILPQILEQVIQCRDALAQEYLLDVIVMAFPAEYHLETLDQYLTAIERLTPQTSLHKVLTLSIDRIVQHIKDTNLTEKIQQLSIEPETPETEGEQVDDSTAKSKEEPAESEKPKNQTEEGNSPAGEKEAAGEPHEQDSAPETAQAVSEPEPEVKETEAAAEPQNAELGEDYTKVLALLDGIYDKYWTALDELKGRFTINGRASVVKSLIQLVLVLNPDKLDKVDELLVFVSDANEKTPATENTSEASSRQSTPAETPAVAPSPYYKDSESEPDTVVALLASLLSSLPILTVLSFPSFHALLKAQDPVIQQRVANQVLKVVLAQGASVSDTEAARKIFELFALVIKAGETNQLNLAELVHLLRASTADANVRLLKQAFQSFREGGVKVIQRTYPSLVSSAFRVLREFPDAGRGELFKFINKTIHDLAAVGALPELALRLYTFAGSVADQLDAQEASYEFYVEAFGLYEEQITDSRAQFQALCVLIGSLQQTTGFTSDNYNTLASRCLMYGQKLLKKPDQCRAVYLSSHLWWQSDDAAGSNNDTKVLEALQRAFSVADACMDTGVSIGLFVEVLDRYLYFYDHGSDLVTAEHITRLIAHIAKQLEDNEDEDSSVIASKLHFERTLDYIRSQVDSEPRFAKLST